MKSRPPNHPHPLFGASREPYYAQLANVLREKIHSGEWAFGDTLPSLEKLMARYSVARVTVRQAVKLLVEEGLLLPQRGRGTLVTGRPDAHRTLNVETTLEKLVHMYRDDQPALINLDEGVESTLPEGVPAPHADAYFRMRRVHSRGEIAYCVINLFIELEVFRQREQDFRTELVLPVLTSIRTLAVGAAQQRLTVVKCDLESARLMDIAPGDPAAHVRRVIRRTDGVIVYFADVTYRGDFIHLDMDLTT